MIRKENIFVAALSITDLIVFNDFISRFKTLYVHLMTSLYNKKKIKRLVRTDHPYSHVQYYFEISWFLLAI